MNTKTYTNLELTTQLTRLASHAYQMAIATKNVTEQKYYLGKADAYGELVKRLTKEAT